jgi:undecaprenyl-diphosphatase
VTFPQSVQSLDESLLRAAQGTPAAVIHVLWILTLVGGGWGLFVLTPFIVRPSTRAVALWLLGCATFVSTCVSLFKMGFARVRPCDALGWCPPVLVSSPGGYSFPSGHAAGSFAFATFLSVLAPRVAPVALPIAAMIAWSRCVLGVHYPSDVAAGALFGALMGAAFAHLYARWRRARGAAGGAAPAPTS